MGGIELTIEACGDNQIGRIHTPKSISEIVAGKQYRIALGDMQEGENRDIPFEVSVSACSSAAEKFPLAKVSLSYFNMKTEAMGECTEEICIARVAELSDEHKEANTEVIKHCNRTLAADAAESAVSLANTGNIEETRSCLEKAAAEIKESVSAGDDLCQGLLQQLETSKSGLASRSTYQQAGQYQMNAFSKCMKMQRCAASAAPDSVDSISFETS